MAQPSSMPSKIDRRLVGEPVVIDGRSVQVVARLRGRLGMGGNTQGGGAGGQFSLEPVELIVREADGVESSLALSDPTSQALRSIAGVAVAVAALSLASSVLVRLARRH